MKEINNYLFLGFIFYMIFSLFFKNSAEADPKQSYENYIAGKAVFLDVREEDEIRDGMIKGAFWFPLSKMEKNKISVISKIKEVSKGKKIYIYCRSGNRSGKVKDYLTNSNIESINLGGYSTLLEKNLPTQSRP
jgi:rhodanese-related sulfurtransferase